MELGFIGDCGRHSLVKKYEREDFKNKKIWNSGTQESTGDVSWKLLIIGS
jgi:hypothetical protein